MGEYKDQKEAKMAMSGRLGMMTGSILLIFTAVSSTLMYGINFLAIAIEAANGTEEYTELLANANLSISIMQVLGAAFLIETVIEIGVGVFGLVNCNRLDKASLSKKVIIVLFVIEILIQILLFLVGVPNLSLLFTSLIIPGYMFWGVTRLGKLAKLYPDRTHAIITRRMKEQRQKRAEAENAAPKKTLRERAEVSRKLKWDEEPEAGEADSAAEAGEEAGEADSAEAAGVESEDPNSAEEN